MKYLFSLFWQRTTKKKTLWLFSFIYSLNFSQQNREKRAKVSHWVHIGKTWKTHTHTHRHHRRHTHTPTHTQTRKRETEKWITVKGCVEQLKKLRNFLIKFFFPKFLSRQKGTWWTARIAIARKICSTRFYYCSTPFEQ